MSRHPYKHPPQSLVFTLDEVQPKPDKSQPAASSESVADWERSLEALRQSKARQARQSAPNWQMDDIFAAEPVALQPTVVAKPKPAPERKKVRTQTNADLLNPIERERVYRAYLQQWQHQHSMEMAQQKAVLNDTAVLLQEDWLAAQDCLQAAQPDEEAVCVFRLGSQGQLDPLPVEMVDLAQAQRSQDTEAHEDGAIEHEATAQAGLDTTMPDHAEAVTHVHIHVLPPQGSHSRAVMCLSESALLAQLSEKLRPHLADAMAGMVRLAVQKQTAQLVTQLQQQLLAEIPAVVDEVLQHNMDTVMCQIKAQQTGDGMV